MINPYKSHQLLRYFHPPRKLTNGDGWVFSKGIAGKWVGKTIAEPLVAQDEGPDSSNEAFFWRGQGRIWLRYTRIILG